MNRRRSSGLSLLELLVVVAIMGILMVALTGGYMRMQANYQVRTSAEKFLSTLHSARSLAITNNTEYEVVVGRYGADNTSLPRIYYFTLRTAKSQEPVDKILLDKSVVFAFPDDESYFDDSGAAAQATYVKFSGDGSAVSSENRISLRGSDVAKNTGKPFPAAKVRTFKVFSGGMIRLDSNNETKAEEEGGG